jgi:type IV pilus assembly protein PilE
MIPSRSVLGRITLIEALTLLVALVVLTAVAIPLWRSHEFDERRADARAALEALEKAQDAYFGVHARYADAALLHAAPPQGLGLLRRSPNGYFGIELERNADGLGYVARARGLGPAGDKADTRCAEFRIDHQGRRTASNAEGSDTTADCWSQL